MKHSNDLMTHSRVFLRPDAGRTVLRPFDPQDPPGFDHQARSRTQRIVDRVLALDDHRLATELRRVTHMLETRHRDFEDTARRQFEVVRKSSSCGDIDPDRALLIGAYFSEEYSFESAALFNPSMVPHIDQDDLPEGAIRFVVSLRGIGEGHLSSVTFRVGTWNATDGFDLVDPSKIAVAPRIEQGDDDFSDGAVRIVCEGSRDVSESVLFPVTATQVRGIEDMRLVRFVEDDGTVRHLGTYTAFDGVTARSELMEADSFCSFDLRAMTGEVAKAKGIALFPRKVGGRYMALGRQDSENIWLIESDSLTRWDGGAKLLEPKYFWEFVQIGNCGSPIEIDEGWLVLTHGVGSVRNYCIGACLLDKDDPSKVLARLPLPLVHPSPKERDGYVPNVVYSCGAMVHDRTLLLPYGVADNFATFASVPLDRLLAAME